MAEAVTAARGAEKAAEDARDAAARAKMLCEGSRKSILELTRLMLQALDGDEQPLGTQNSS
jgi:hypothetical protein